MELRYAIWVSAGLGLAAVCSYSLIHLLKPFWQYYALARPNARSSHKAPTPQGGGIVVVTVTCGLVAFSTAVLPGADGLLWHFAWVLMPVLFLTIVGAIDDVHVLGAIPRLLMQTAAVAVVIASMPADLRIFDFLPWWAERAILLIGSVWFVNLVNFMDGVDWMTVAEVVPVTAGLTLFGLMGALPLDATIVAVALCGATIGFAPFNRPVAHLFLGDVGSLPVGLMLGWLLILLAANHLAAALLLPLYYTADATVTLLRRLLNGERVMQAHRSHFYQRALIGGWSVHAIVGRVFALNAMLIVLAALTIVFDGLFVQVAALALGCVLVGWQLYRFQQEPNVLPVT